MRERPRGKGHRPSHRHRRPALDLPHIPLIELSEAEPGDIIITGSGGIVAGVIGLAQWLRPSERPWRQARHVAILTCRRGDAGDPNSWEAIQAGRYGVFSSYLEGVAPHGNFVVTPCPDHVDRRVVLQVLHQQCGTSYGFLTNASIALNLLTPRAMRVDLRYGGRPTWICSALAAAALLAGGWVETLKAPDLYQLSPAGLCALRAAELKEATP